MKIEQTINQLCEQYSQLFLRPYKLKHESNQLKINQLQQKEQKYTKKLKTSLAKTYNDYLSKITLAKDAIFRTIETDLEQYTTYIKRAEGDLLRQDVHNIQGITVIGPMTEEECLFELFQYHIKKDFWTIVKKEFNKTGSKKGSSINDLTFLQLFKNNEDQMNRFFALLKRPEIAALDENNNWIYNSRKSSIVACFKALSELAIIKPNINAAQLQRIVGSSIAFNGNDKLFRNNFNQDDYEVFSTLFQNQLSKRN